MKQKLIIIALLLGLVLSNLLAITSLSLTRQIKPSFSVDGKEFGQSDGLPPSEDGRTIEYKKGLYKGETLNEKLEEFFSFSNTNQQNIFKVAANSSIVILLMIVIYFLRKRYKKKRKRNNKRNEIEEVQIQPNFPKNKDDNDIFHSSKKKRVTAYIQIHEIRRLLLRY
ncbi:MAG: hypothetical protein ABWY25_05330 [Paenisporosarcina sp.]